MNEVIEINKQHKKLKPTSLNIRSGINLLVGTNGSGKSSLLEYIFETQNKTRIAYSSGINESFSLFYEEYLNKLSKKLKRRLSQTNTSIPPTQKNSGKDSGACLFFTKKWFPFLIIAATFLKQDNSLTKKFLDELSLSINKLSFRYILQKPYRDKFNSPPPAVSGLAEEGTSRLGQVSSFDETPLDIFLRVLPEEEIDYSSPNKLYSLPSEDSKNPQKAIIEHLFESEIFKDGAENFFNKLIVLSHGKNPKLPLEDVFLEFKNKEGVKLNQHQLSDGEFQMLIVSSLFDIFDSPDTFFLFDEIDAHIHPSKISNIWNKFNSLKGYLLTSSHNLTSISITDANKIYFLENGLIQNENKKIAEIIQTLSGEYFNKQVHFSLCLNYKTIILIDGEEDWIIFLELCKKLNLDTSIFDKEFIVIKCPSGTTKNCDLEDLCDNKIEWVEDFKKCISKLEHFEDIRLKHIVFFCDKDEFELEKNRISYIPKINDKRQKEVSIKLKKDLDSNKNLKINIQALVLNRRCIENYLISKNARVKRSIEITDDLISEWKVPESERNSLRSQKKLLSQYFIGHTRDNEPKNFQTEDINSNKIRETMHCKEPIRSCINKDPQKTRSGLDLKKLKNYINDMDKDDLDPKLKEYYRELVKLS